MCGSRLAGRAMLCWAALHRTRLLNLLFFFPHDRDARRENKLGTEDGRVDWGAIGYGIPMRHAWREQRGSREARALAHAFESGACCF
ncbi:hypothetical protein B0J12DRAFT_90692 [Macrophomina phaseolina]|uniref:Secreted protein n=1 Tax=Macrophomina phaseolina TaxID=35725 RepID=A0ABQ8GBM9_9PEZI|nr:hypothetical protein B0J12DRAFT_90692 [Macrophomina phaseolina]